jgi:hypothetical protein
VTAHALDLRLTTRAQRAYDQGMPGSYVQQAESGTVVRGPFASWGEARRVAFRLGAEHEAIER